MLSMYGRNGNKNESLVNPTLYYTYEKLHVKLIYREVDSSDKRKTLHAAEFLDNKLQKHFSFDLFF